MTKFDSYNSDHINLFNAITGNAAKYFAKSNARGMIYYSDCIRDVEALTDCKVGEIRYWIVEDTSTILVCKASDAEALYERASAKAMFTIEHRQTEYGTKWFDILLVAEK